MPGLPVNNDVVILGGGLAGLTLARDLRRRDPNLAVTVVEKSRFPVAEASHKVGESTVEIGAHYLAERLGLGDHLNTHQLTKFGLRLFFGGVSPSQNLADYDEVGASDYLPITSYQIDRGRLENYLAEEALADGVSLMTGSRVHGVQLGEGGADHRVIVRDSESERSLRSRWLVDASGRRRMLCRELGLVEKIAHRNAAVWMRVDRSLDVDDWGHGEGWLERCGGRPRRLSTNHFMGRGYWVWVIPLASGATSIGLVFEPSLIPFGTVNSAERLLAWLQEHQPLVGARLQDAGARVLDFGGLRGYAHASRQVFSGDRWAVTGDAGMFADPFYSPGNDFIALSNTLTCSLIDSGGDARTLARTARVYEQVYRSVFDSTLSLYEGQYPGFGHVDLMSAKTVWDYAYYWGVLAKLFYTGVLTDAGALMSSASALQQTLRWNTQLQSRLRELAGNLRPTEPAGRFLDHYRVPAFHQFKRSLLDAADQPSPSELNIDLAQLQSVSDRVSQALEAISAGRQAPAPEWMGELHPTS